MAMKGCIERYATNIALMKPATNPTPRAAAMAAGIDIPAKTIFPATAAATNIVEPTERSMPAVRSVQVIPAATIAIEEDWTRIFARLVASRKRGASNPNAPSTTINIKAPFPKPRIRKCLSGYLIGRFVLRMPIGGFSRR